MELLKYYSLDECSDIKKIKKILNQLKNDEKIDLNIDGDIIKIIDIDLDIDEIDEIIKMFDKYDVIPYIKDDDDDDNEDDDLYSSYYDEEY